MGRLVARHTTMYCLELSGADLRKQDIRRRMRNTFPAPTKGETAFCEKLPSCPICGAKPQPLIVGDYGDYSIKMSCSESPFHLSIGDWKKGFARAGKEWIRRTHDEAQIKYDREKLKRWSEKEADAEWIG